MPLLRLRTRPEMTPSASCLSLHSTWKAGAASRSWSVTCTTSALSPRRWSNSLPSVPFSASWTRRRPTGGQGSRVGGLRQVTTSLEGDDPRRPGLRGPHSRSGVEDVALGQHRVRAGWQTGDRLRMGESQPFGFRPSRPSSVPRQGVAVDPGGYPQPGRPQSAHGTESIVALGCLLVQPMDDFRRAPRCYAT